MKDLFFNMGLYGLAIAGAILGSGWAWSKLRAALPYLKRKAASSAADAAQDLRDELKSIEEVAHARMDEIERTIVAKVKEATSEIEARVAALEVKVGVTPAAEPAPASAAAAPSA